MKKLLFISITFLLGFSRYCLSSESELNSKLINAVDNGTNLDEINKLLDVGANINMIGRSKLTPLMRAIQRNYPNVVKLLLNRNANVNFQNEDKNTALILAVTFNYPIIAQMLLNKGADINAVNRHGKSVFAIAIDTVSQEMQELLICYRDQYLPYLKQSKGLIKGLIKEHMPDVLTDITDDYVTFGFTEFREINKC